MRSTSNEIGRLAQGLKRGVKDTNTIKFIKKEDVPAERKDTYGSFVIDTKAHKEETERTRLTFGGDQIGYTGGKSTQTVGLTTAKMLFNSTISTPGARFLVKLLCEHPPRMLRINGRHDGIPPIRGNWRIRFKRPSSRWQGVHRNPKRHVRPPTSRHSC
jgi:hypothetical protein